MPTIINGDGVVTAGGTASTQGKVVLAEQTGSGTNTVTIQAPATLAADLTFTMPTADGTSGQFLRTDGTGNLSFATATTSPAGSTGQLQYNNAGAFGAVSSGTSGQVLQSAGAGTPPTWATPATGALVFLSSQTVSSSTAAVSFTSGINSTYDDYLITFENVQFTTVGGNYVMITVRLQQNGSFQTGSTYDYTVLGVNGTATEIENAVNQTRMFIQTGRYGTFGDAPRSGFLYLLNVNSTASRGCGVTAVSTSRGTAANRSQTATGGGTSSVAAAVTGIQFLSDNNIDMTAGTFRLYGIAKS